jgi:hypothetical protein
MAYKTVYTEIEVEVDIADFETDDLLEELEARGSLPVESSIDAKEIVESIWLLRRLGKDYQTELNALIYTVLGKIV